MKGNNVVAVTGIICVATVVVVWILVGAVGEGSAEETVTVDGIAEVSVVPDLVSVYLNVETLENSANVAKDKNAEIVAKIKDALIEEGFSRDDFETQNFNVYEEFDWSEKGGRESLGFKAVHSIVVKIDSEDEEMIGKAIDLGVNNGAMLSYVNFALSQEKENEYKALALKMAAEDAKVKGEAVASGLGLRLGDVVSTKMSEGGFWYNPSIAYASEDSVLAVKGAEIATNIQVAEQKVRSQISVTYELD